MKAKKFALILVAVLIAALLAGCLAACNKDEKPVLTVTIGSQQVPYSPDGVQPYTDGTQVQVDRARAQRAVRRSACPRRLRASCF